MKVNLHPHKKFTGWYTLDYRPDGAKGKRVREHYDSYESAAAVKESLEGGPKQAPTFPRLADVVEEYLSWAKLNLSAATYTRKRARFTLHIIPALGRHRVKELTQRMLDAYGSSMARGSYRTDVVEVMALIRWMVKRRFAEPLTWAPELPAYKATIKHLPSVEEIKRFIAALKTDRDRTICNLMLYSGLRWNEVKNLKWENYREGSILVAVTKTGTPEVLTIPDVVAEWFQRSKAGSGFIFSSTRGRTPLNYPAKPLAAAAKKTGVKMTAHMFRHASATFLYELTNDLYAVQHHLRHSKITTSQIYARYSAVRRKASIDRLADMLDNVDNDQNELTP